MNFKIVTIILLVSFCSLSMSAQLEVLDARTPGYDSLVIERLNGHRINLVWDFRRNIKSSENWKELIMDFQDDFQKVSEDLPVFDFYEIKYIHNTNLVVDEIRGRETYTVNDEDELIYTKSNACRLTGKDISITIEFNDKSELLDSSLVNDIRKGVEKIKHRFYFSNISRQRHYFNVEKNEMIKAPKPKISFIIPIGARLGLVKDNPYIEIRPGLGLLVGSQNVFSLNANFMIKYDELSNATQNDIYLGFNWMTFTNKSGLGVEYAVKVSEGIEDFEDLVFRTSLNYKTSSGIIFGLDYYLRDSNFRESENILFGFNIGFGF